MAQTPQPQPKPQRTPDDIRREKEILRTQKLMQKFIKERQKDQRTGGSVANKKLTRKSLKGLDKVGVQSRSAAKEFGAEKPQGLTSVLVGSAKEKGAEIAGSLPGAGVVKFFRKRNLQSKAFEKLQKKRKDFLSIIKECAKENPTGYAKLIQSVKKSYKGKDNITEVLIDTLIQMGITTKEELLGLLDQLAGGAPDEAIESAISQQVSQAGFETKSTGLRGLSQSNNVSLEESVQPSKSLGPVDFSKSSELSPASSSSNLQLNNIENELKLQTQSLSAIEKSLSGGSGDKAKEREEKLEGEREASVASAGLGGSLDLPDLDGDGDNGGGGGISGMITTAIMGLVGSAFGVPAGSGALQTGKIIAQKVGIIKTPTPSVTPPRTPSTPPPMPGGAPAPPPPAPTTAPKPRGFFGRMFDRAKGAIKTGKDFVGRGFSAAKNVVGSGISAAKNLATGPMLKAIKQQAGPILKSIGRKLPIIGPAISGLISLIDINTIKNDPSLSAKEKKEAIGKSLGSALGMALGSVGGAALGTLIPVPIVGTLAGSFAGGFLGDYIGSNLAGWVGGENVYNVLEKMPGLGSIIGLDEEETPSVTPSPSAVSSLPTTPETTPQTGPMVGTGSAKPVSSSSRADQAAQSKARLAARNDLKSQMGVSTLPAGVVTDVKPTDNGYTATATIAGRRGDLSMNTSSQIDRSTRNEADMSSSPDGNRPTNIVTPISSSTTTNNTNVSNKSIAQEEASFLASQMINGGSGFSAHRFA